MKKDLTPQDRFDLAQELEELSANIELDADDGKISEDDAKARMELLDRAIAVICTDYIAARERSERDAAAFYESMSRQQIAAYASEIGTKYPAPSPDSSGTPPAAPKVIPFTKGKNKK